MTASMTRTAQPRWLSATEAIANVVVGYALAVLVQIIVFPIFGLTLSLSGNLALGAIFTAVSLVRSYALRRIFERLARGTP